CPLGALIAGSHQLMTDARRLKHLFGGAMRQAGVVAAAGLYALDHHVAKLADDHARARRLGLGLIAAGLPGDVNQLQTNFVLLNVRALGLEQGAALDRLRTAGVLWSAGTRPSLIRAVTHLEIDDDDIEVALTRSISALSNMTTAK